MNKNRNEVTKIETKEQAIMRVFDSLIEKKVDWERYMDYPGYRKERICYQELHEIEEKEDPEVFNGAISVIFKKITEKRERIKLQKEEQRLSEIKNNIDGLKNEASMFGISLTDYLFVKAVKSLADIASAVINKDFC